MKCSRQGFNAFSWPLGGSSVQLLVQTWHFTTVSLLECLWERDRASLFASFCFCLPLLVYLWPQHHHTNPPLLLLLLSLPPLSFSHPCFALLIRLDSQCVIYISKSFFDLPCRIWMLRLKKEGFSCAFVIFQRSTNTARPLIMVTCVEAG